MHRFPDLHMTERGQKLLGQRCVLSRLSLGFVGLIFSVDVTAILEGTAYDFEDIEVIVEFIEDFDRTSVEWANTSLVFTAGFDDAHCAYLLCTMKGMKGLNATNRFTQVPFIARAHGCQTSLA